MNLFIKRLFLLTLLAIFSLSLKAYDFTVVDGAYIYHYETYNSGCVLDAVSPYSDQGTKTVTIRKTVTDSYGVERNVVELDPYLTFKGLDMTLVMVENPEIFQFRAGMFESCRNLGRIQGLEDAEHITEIPERTFYDCPRFGIPDNIKGLKAIRSKAFALSDENDNIKMGCYIPGTIEEITDDAFENRIYGSVTFMPGEKTLYISGGNTYRFPFVAEYFNISRSISGYTDLKDGAELVIRGIYATAEATNLPIPVENKSNSVLEDIQLVGYSGTINLNDYPNLKQVYWRGAKGGSLSVGSGNDALEAVYMVEAEDASANIGGGYSGPDSSAKYTLSGTFLKLIMVHISEEVSLDNVTGLNQLIISDMPYTALDLSGINCYGDEQYFSVQDCKSLTTLYFPENLTGQIDYEYLKSLKDVYIGSKVTDIYAFNAGYKHEVVYGGSMADWCKVVRRFNKHWEEDSKMNICYYNSSLPSYMSKVEKLWYGAGKEKVNCLTELTLNDVDSITPLAFAGYAGLTSVRITGDTYIGFGAFNNCSNLKEVYINGGTVGVGAFYTCKSISQITIGDKTKCFKPYAFKTYIGMQDVITRVDYEGTASQWAQIDFQRRSDNNMSYSAFNNPLSCANGGFYIGGKLAETIELDNITKVNDFAFRDAKDLKTVYVSKVHYIGYGAFSYCPNLESIKLIGSIKNTSAKSVDIPGVTLGDEVFYEDAKLKEVAFLDDVVEIGKDAFKGTSLLDDVANGPVYVGRALYSYKGDVAENTRLDVKDGTVSITANALKNLENITSITFPNTLVRIGEGSIEGTGISGTVVIPNSVKWFASKITSGKVKNLVIEDGEEPICQTPEIEGLEELYMGRNFQNSPIIDEDGVSQYPYFPYFNEAMSSSVKTLTFGEKVTEIPYSVIPTFIYDRITVRSFNPVPPTLPATYFNLGDQWTVFDRIHFINECTLEVPEESLELYRAADGWKEFGTITSMAGVEDVVADSDAYIVKYVSTTGVSSDKPFKGLNIIVMSNGSTRKVMMK